MEKLLELLKGLKPEVDFEKEKALIDDNILGSFDVISLVSEINDAFDVNIGAESLVPENFNSAEAMYSLITELQDE